MNLWPILLTVMYPAEVKPPAIKIWRIISVVENEPNAVEAIITFYFCPDFI